MSAEVSRFADALAVVGSHGLPEAMVGGERASVVVSADEMGVLRGFCRGDRLSGLLAAAVTSGEVLVPAEALDGVDADWHDMLRACVLVEAMLVRVAARFDDLGVRWAVSKGAAVAHSDFPVVGWRGFADVDVIVHPDDWPAVLLEFAGPVGRGSATRRFTARFGKGETVLVDDMELDLHVRFAVGRFGVRSNMVEVFDGLDTITLAGWPVPVLSPAFRLLHACFHAALGGGRGVRALRDVAQIAATHPDCVGEMWAVADRWRAVPVVAAAVVDAWSVLGLDRQHPLCVAADGARVGRADARALRVFRLDGSFRAQALTGFAGLGWRDRPAFLWSGWRMLLETSR